MATFQKCGDEVLDLAADIIKKFETNHPIRDRGVRIDYIFAYGDRDEETGELKSNALTRNGIRALGITRKISLKDRAKGMGDAEITLDHDHWERIEEKEQEALLAHEIHHIAVSAKNDDLGRPIIKLRKHDVDIGWFKVIAERYTAHSIECQQAQSIFDQNGQAFWPTIASRVVDHGEVSARAVRTAR